MKLTHSHYDALSFLQTKKWAEFQKSLGAECFNIDGALIVKYKLPFNNNYLYIPRSKIKIADLRELWHIQKDNTLFLRIEPEIKNSDQEFIKRLRIFGFKKVNQESMPSSTLILDLNKTEKELLASMHQKTRYNIRLAEKKGVGIEIKDNLSEGEFEAVWDLIKKTASRDGFSSFSKEYYRKLLNMFECAGELAPRIKIVLARCRENIIAIAIIMFCEDTATYLHGASDYARRDLMAPYLVQWSAIRKAKKAGCEFYDFWGVDEKKWPGVTRFKKGFGGKVVEYIGTYDLIFNKKWYYAYKLFKKLKSKI